MEEIKQLVEELNQAFMEHKVKNDQRLAEIQKKVLPTRFLRSRLIVWQKRSKT